MFAVFVLKAQSPVFKVDCGNDTVFCSRLYADTSFHIGTKVKIYNGTAPFTYKWSCKYQYSYYIATASNFLNDTSILNPFIKVSITGEKRSLHFYLAVKDKNDNVATDSITIRPSSFIYSAGEYEFYLHKGDSMQFFEGFVVVGGGIPPLKYYWTPTVGLDDSSKINAWCKPQQSTFYYQYVIDSAGCKSVPNGAYIITILPTSVKNIGDMLNLHQSGNRMIFCNSYNKLAKLSFYSIDGKKIYTGETTDSFFVIPNLLDKNSITICVLSLGGITSSLKIYNQKD